MRLPRQRKNATHRRGKEGRGHEGGPAEPAEAVRPEQARKKLLIAA